MRAAIYDRFWHSQGGGERHCGMIGVVLSQDGVEVDFLGHQELDKDALAEHLGLDLSGVGRAARAGQGRPRGRRRLRRLRPVRQRLLHEPARAARRRNAYLCYFPTPFDADLTPWRRTLIRALGRHVRAAAGGLTFGTGWFPPEGGRRGSGSGRAATPSSPCRPAGPHAALRARRPGLPSRSR
jgi:hypothetical protein